MPSWPDCDARTPACFSGDAEDSCKTAVWVEPPSEGAILAAAGTGIGTKLYETSAGCCRAAITPSSAGDLLPFVCTGKGRSLAEAALNSLERDQWSMRVRMITSSGPGNAVSAQA